MTKQTNTTKIAAYKVKQANRKRFSFGKVWAANVLAGNVKDRAKLVAHAVQLKVGVRSAVTKLSTTTLLAKVQKALTATVAAA